MTDDDPKDEVEAAKGPATSEIDESDDDVLTLVKKSRKESDKHLADWLNDAREWYDLVSGDQWTSDDKAALDEMNRPHVSFNRIQPVIESVCGTEVANRQQVQFLPRRMGPAGAEEVLTGAATWVRDNCDAEDEESDAFFDVVVCGIGVTETRFDQTDDPEGQILIERRDPLTMRYDPAAKKRNLTDRRWNQREEWLSKEDIESKWPDAGTDLTATDLGKGESEGTQHDATNANQYKKDANGYDPENGKFRVIHHEWFTLKCVYRIQDPGTGQIIELDEDKYKALEVEATKRGIPLESNKQERKVYKEAFVCGSTVLEKKLGPSQKGFCFQFITGKRDRNKNTWYGLVKSMADPQRWANKFFSQILHIINTNAKGGLMIEESATDNQAKLEKDWAKAESISVFTDGALSSGKVLPKPANPFPIGPEKMMEFSISSIRDASGVNLEQMGLADRAQAGYLEAQRKQSGLTILAGLFDSLRHYRKVQGRILADFIKNFLSDGRLVRITGQDGSEKFIPLIRQDETMMYDVIVDEAPTSHNVKERVFGMTTQALPVLMQAGFPPPPAELLDSLPLPAAFIEKWKQKIQAEAGKPNPQVQLEQAKMAQAQQIAANDSQMKQQEAAQSAQLDQQKMANDAQNKEQDRLLQYRIAQEQMDREDGREMMRIQADREKHTEELQNRVAVAKVGARATILGKADELDQDRGLADMEGKPSSVDRLETAFLKIAEMVQAQHEHSQRPKQAIFGIRPDGRHGIIGVQ